MTADPAKLPASKGQPASYSLILSYLTLRRIIGWIAVLLPLVLVAARLFFHKQFNIPVQWPDSAGGFYYTGDYLTALKTGQVRIDKPRMAEMSRSQPAPGTTR